MGKTHALCDVPAQSMKGARWRQAVVEKVVDGDTLHVSGGERIRLVGVNAPETAKFGKPGDPLGREAMRGLADIAVPGTPVFLRDDRQPRDRYKRSLSHPFLADGRNITARLLEAGMGFHVTLPPNVWQAECYREAEDRARRASRGVWGLAHFRPVPSTELSRLKGGYARVEGAVERIVLTRRVAWVELTGHVSLKLEKRYLDHVDGIVWQRLLEAHDNDGVRRLPPVEVRGWASDRRQWNARWREQVASGERKPFQFNVRHRFDWRFATPDEDVSRVR